MRKSSASLAIATLAAFSVFGLLAAAPAGAATSVMISNFSFQPASVTVPVGSTVTWVNRDSTMHSVTSDTGAFDSGNGLCPPTNCLAQGATFSHQFSSAGTYKYHCNVHPYMQGTVVVTGPSATTAPTAPPTTAPRPTPTTAPHTTPTTAPTTMPNPAPPGPSSTTTPPLRSAPPTTAPTTSAPPGSATASTQPGVAPPPSAGTPTTTQGTSGGPSNQAAPAAHHGSSSAGLIIGLIALIAVLGGGAVTFARRRGARG